MTNKIGRNDPCLCGSGLKYKRCCINKNSSNISFLDFAWNSIRKTEGAVIDKHLFPYVEKELPKGFINIAYNDFCLEELPEAMDAKLLFNNFFIPWFLFDWIPLVDFDIPQFDLNMTIAQNYIKSYRNQLNDSEKRFIEIMDTTYYSFYSVLKVEFEESLFIKDIILGTTHTIKEKLGTHKLKRGDIVFSRILTVDKQSIFIGMAPFIVPAQYNTDLINFRNWLIEENDNEKLSPALLRNEFATVLLDYYFEIITIGFNNPFPTLCNTDGELIQFSKSYFNLTITPEETLNKLLPLTLANNSKDFLEDAERDKNGKVERIEFPWLKKGNKQHKDWDNTVMGQIILENGKLTLETNSNNRMEQGKTLIKKYLGELIRFERSVIENTEQMLKSTSKEAPEESAIYSEPLMLPEVQGQVGNMAKRHWENWFDEPIPALGNKTPREASKTSSGLEMLEALLLQYERHNANMNNSPYKPDIEYLKRKLGVAIALAN